MKPPVRTARIDIRVSPQQKAMLERLAKERYRTITSLLDEWLAWVEKQEGAKK